MPRVPYVSEGIRIQPNADEAAALSAKGFALFDGFIPVHELRKRKRVGDELDSGGREKRMKLDLQEQHQRQHQYELALKQARAEVIELKRRVEELERKLSSQTKRLH